MASAEHTYGPKCRLAPVHHVDKEDGMPPVDAQFFYSSLIPIDDPLSTSSVGGGSDARSTRNQLRPFARGDNNALEKAWLSLASEDHRRDHQDARGGRRRSPETDGANIEKRARLVQAMALRHWERHHHGFQPQDLSVPVPETAPSGSLPVCCSALLLEVLEELNTNFCALNRKIDPTLDPESIVQDVLVSIGHLRQSAAASTGTPQATAEAASSSRPEDDTGTNPAGSVGRRYPISSAEDGGDSPHSSYRVASVMDKRGRPRSVSQLTNRSSRTDTPVGSPTPPRPPPVDDGISGKPFIRVGTDVTPMQPMPPPSARLDSPAPEVLRDEASGHEQPLQGNSTEAMKAIIQAEAVNGEKYGKGSVEVAVGVSRLHMVSLPMLHMKPIYWSPINDMAVVTRATWFYKDNMLPVPPAVANQLEAGYHELRPWTETWRDEIRCAIEVGPLGEEKVSHRLWPKESELSHGDGRKLWEPPISSEPFCAACCYGGEAAAEGSIEPIQVREKDEADKPNRPFSNYHAIYKNQTEAFLLKPSLKPSAYYGRKPLWKIMKGVTVGIPVVRGFDRETWERIHVKKQPPNKPGVSAASESHESSGRGVCPACKADKDRGQVTDLVLVAHGIGQKFAERVESFHFTHAINSFRRAVNIELGTPIVQQVLREGQNGLMILPLNWRMGLSFGDGGPLREEDKDNYMPEGFGLKDIEPDTIPAIRSMISDVMFDIPFYMSHHKGKMISALVSEANRVYRLWCRNNPGFADKGRVHLIGHSLGSAMAIEVLSHQPTSLPKLDLSRMEPETRFFEFDTKNLFLVGSPAGFFLLLERGVLLPRRGRLKPGADPVDTAASDIVADAGTYGCVAVDNVFNVLAKEDPIAYLLNGAVDSAWAASLKKAYVPSTATPFLKSVGDAMRNVVPGMAPAADAVAPDMSAAEPDRPAPGARLPSQLELEVHDFTREEIAEKKAFLLNDNGQLDYFLHSGGGPLEIQYLNMLSAHTSYWTNHDFIRMLCMEVGRRPGRAHTLPAMRAAKATKRLLPG